MRTCVYCLERKPDDAFDREHVIPQAFGTFERNLVLDCVCKDCNQYFANSIDRKFARDSAEALDRYWSGMKPTSEFKSLGPNSTTSVKFKDGAIQGGTGYAAANPDGPDLKVFAFPQIGLEQPPNPIRWFRPEELPEKEQLTDRGFERGKPYVIHLREMHPVVGRELLAAKGYVLEGDFVTSTPPAETVETEMVGTIGVPEKRMATKIAINYLAAIAGPGLVLTSPFADVRHFARYDQGESHVHVSENPWRCQPPGEKPMRGHYLVAQTMPNGLIVAQVSLFLRIRYVMHLMTTTLATGAFMVGQGHFFDIDFRTVRRMAPLPLVPGKQLQVAAK